MKKTLLSGLMFLLILAGTFGNTDVLTSATPLAGSSKNPNKKREENPGISLFLRKKNKAGVLVTKILYLWGPSGESLVQIDLVEKGKEQRYLINGQSGKVIRQKPLPPRQDSLPGGDSPFPGKS